MKASITLAPDFFVMILVVNNFVSSKSNQKQMKPIKRDNGDKSSLSFRRRIVLPAELECWMAKREEVVRA